MYECPNCASNLKFDIARQSMFCEACGTVMSPYDVTKELDAEEREDFEVTVFTCPQCGAQIVSEDNEAAAFCSFCGGSTILDSRISKEKRPEFILPFKRTKDDCLTSFKSMTKRAIFSPNEVKDYKDIDSFRGIYMPYWMYTAVKQGHACYDVRKTISKYRGDYEYIDHFNFDTDLDVNYTGVTFDASSSFSDRLSQAIEPFDTNQVEKFTPSFLSGFYADTLDVDGEVYDKQVEELTTQAVFSKLNSDAVMKGHSTTFDKAKKQLGTSIAKRTLVMLPVWFMSLRHKETGKEDRVAYVAVNGQTGEACADLPIDIKKYMIGAVIATVAFFALFTLLPTMKPLILTIISGIFAIVSGIIYYSQNATIEKQEKGEDDEGMMFARKKGILKAIPKFDTITGKKLKYTDPDSKINFLGIKFDPAGTAIIASIVIAIGLFLLRPVSDIPYYVGTMIILVLVFMLLYKLMKRYNRLVTRPLPQFNRTGGDDSAKTAIRDHERKEAENANSSQFMTTDNDGNGGGK
ncbi:MAG: zinc ribbon domain-containing protein [Lachnospiraceae bacterium]|nr:zinc ribbon domain-containing protein [Lachnospiraceae bacterium]